MYDTTSTLRKILVAGAAAAALSVAAKRREEERGTGTLPEPLPDDGSIIIRGTVTKRIDPG